MAAKRPPEGKEEARAALAQFLDLPSEKASRESSEGGLLLPSLPLHSSSSAETKETLLLPSPPAAPPPSCGCQRVPAPSQPHTHLHGSSPPAALPSAPLRGPKTPPWGWEGAGLTAGPQNHPEMPLGCSWHGSQGASAYCHSSVSQQRPDRPHSARAGAWGTQPCLGPAPTSSWSSHKANSAHQTLVPITLNQETCEQKNPRPSVCWHTKGLGMLHWSKL